MRVKPKSRIIPMPVFWRKNKFLYLGLNLISIVTEMAFLVISIKVLVENYHSETCSEENQQERLRAALVLMELLHFYNIARIVYKTYINF